MTDKKAFILYRDYEKTVDKLSNEQAGIVFKKIFDYLRTGEEEPCEDFASDLVFGVIKEALDRDGEKWKKTVIEREVKGRLGGIIRSLRAEQNISDDKIQFLKENGYLEEEYLAEQGIKEEQIEKIILRSNSLGF